MTTIDFRTRFVGDEVPLGADWAVRGIARDPA